MKRSLTILMMLALGLFVFACEVEDDTTDTVDETTGAETTPLECDKHDGLCDPDCVAEGTFDPDCCMAEDMDGVCDAAKAKDGKCDPDCYDATLLEGEKDCRDNDDFEAILEDWFQGFGADGEKWMSPTARNCDWTPAVCDAQFRCDAGVAVPRPCFCDPDCYAHTATGELLEIMLPCDEDGHCDTWCPTDTDPDCPMDNDGDGVDEDDGAKCNP